MRDGKRRTTSITVEAAPEVESETIDSDSDFDSDEQTTLEVFDGAEVSNIPSELELRGGDAGVYVADVKRGSRASRAGLRRGDIIRRVGKIDVDDLDDFEDVINSSEGPYALRVERRGQTLYLAVK